MSTPDSEAANQLHAAVGEMVLAWNGAEMTLTFILNTLCRELSGPPSADSMFIPGILTAHMGNVALANALRTISAEFAEPVLQEHLNHFIEITDRIREYRNYYVHGISDLSVSETDGVVGHLQSDQARGRIVRNLEFVTIPKLRKTTENCLVAKQYGTRILNHIFTRKEHISLNPVPLPPLTSQDKPPLPDRLLKPRLFLRDAIRQPPASQE